MIHSSQLLYYKHAIATANMSLLFDDTGVKTRAATRRDGEEKRQVKRYNLRSGGPPRHHVRKALEAKKKVLKAKKAREKFLRDLELLEHRKPPPPPPPPSDSAPPPYTAAPPPYTAEHSDDELDELDDVELREKDLQDITDHTEQDPNYIPPYDEPDQLDIIAGQVKDPRESKLTM